MSAPTTPPVRVQVRDPGTLLAVVPYLLGFKPRNSLVAVGFGGPRSRVKLTLRYDLPDPPGRAAGNLAAHLAKALARNNLRTVALIGYGSGRLVTPLIDSLLPALDRARIEVHDALRAEHDRYWSYLCADPACCPPEGGLITGGSHPAARALAGSGLTAAASRDEIAATIAPATGPAAEAMARATREAEIAHAARTASLGPDAARLENLRTVRDAITACRDGRAICELPWLARISLALTDIEVRDDAWARMRPEHGTAHLRLWTEVTRHAQPGYAATPASLLAFTAWQAGQGTIANLAADRALADDPAHPMAQLIRDALNAGLPPSAAVLSMTPRQVAAGYQAQRRRNRRDRSA